MSAASPALPLSAVVLACLVGCSSPEPPVASPDLAALSADAQAAREQVWAFAEGRDKDSYIGPALNGPAGLALGAFVPDAPHDVNDPGMFKEKPVSLELQSKDWAPAGYGVGKQGFVTMSYTAMFLDPTEDYSRTSETGAALRPGACEVAFPCPSQHDVPSWSAQSIGAAPVPRRPRRLSTMEAGCAAKAALHQFSSAG